MKFFVYGLVMMISYGLSFGLLPLVIPAWLAVDLVLILILCIAQATKDYTAFAIGLIMGVIIDIFISPAFGLNTIIYSLYAFLYAKLCFKTDNSNVIITVLAIFIFYILKDIGYMTYGIIYGTKFEYFKMLLNMTLPSAALNSLIGFVVYFIVLKLHELRALRAKRELDFLRSYREQTDWLSSWFEQYK